MRKVKMEIEDMLFHFDKIFISQSSTLKIGDEYWNPGVEKVRKTV